MIVIRSPSCPAACGTEAGARVYQIPRIHCDLIRVVRSIEVFAYTESLFKGNVI